MKNKVPALYDTFRNEIMNSLVASRITKDVAVRKTSEDLIEEELTRLRKKHPDEEWTEEDAIDEIVARACEDMLRNSDAARKFIGKLKPAEQKKIIAKLKEIVKNLLEWVNNLLKEYTSNSYEAQLLGEYKENLKKLSKMWDEMLVTAVENNQALQSEKTSENKQSKDVLKKQYSERDYSYNEIVSKGDMQGVIVKNNQQVKLTADGSIDVKWVIDRVREKCKTKQTHSAFPTYYVEVLDLGENVIVDRNSILHGFIKSQTDNGKKVPDKALLNARVSLELPEILKNSIEVNRSVRGDNPNVPYSHIMIGTVALEDSNRDLEFYAVRSVIEERINQDPILTEAEILGRLHAINAKK